MIRLGVALAVALTVTTSLANAAGFQFVTVPATGAFEPLKGGVWYPCSQPGTEIRLGPFAMSVAKDCRVAGEKLPLVVFSHGRGGNFLGHRDTAEALADAGFVVVAINHPGDTALDMSRTGDMSVFLERPADMKRVVDHMLGSWPDAARIDADRIGIFGFSRGGYTGLVTIGAEPNFGTRFATCEGQDSTDCQPTGKNERPKLSHDPRIKAAVIADPLAIFFTDESFSAVKVPVQLWSSELGGDGVTREDVARIASRLPAKPDLRVVPHSQHFSFLAPCPADLTRVLPEACIDGKGFDRPAFHEHFNAEVLAFFRAHLRG